MSGLTLTNEGNRAEILMYARIGGIFPDGITPMEVSAMLAEVPASSILNVKINSEGGELWAGMTIYNMLLNHPARVEIDIEGVAASISSVIAMAGDEIRMAETATIMIHDPHGMVAGSAKAMRAMADRADIAKESMILAYERKMNNGSTAIAEMMSAETWFSAKEAVAIGLADKTLPGGGLMNSLDLSGLDYQNVPEHLKAKLDTEKKEPPKDPAPTVEPWKAKHRARVIDLAEVQ